MKRKINYIFLFMMALFIVVMNVDAETAKYTYEKKAYCYKNSTGEYVKTVGVTINNQDDIKVSCGSGNNDTIIKKLDGEDAYCPQSKLVMPVGNSTCKTKSYDNVWTEEKAYKAGAAIAYIKSKETSNAKQVVYAVNALNYILRFQGSSWLKDKTKYADRIEEAIAVADGVSKSSVQKFSANPIASFKFNSTILQRAVSGGKYVYSRGVINAKLVNKEKVSITYALTCQNCTLYSDSTLKNAVTSLSLAAGQSKDLSLYVKTTGDSGTKVTVSIKPTATVNVDIAKYWNCKSGKQGLITLGTKKHTLTNNGFTIIATVPDPNKRSLYFSKVDSSGSLLKGADVTVSLSGDVTCSTSDGKCQCNTAGDSSCNLSLTSDATSVSYQINEVTAPNGYITSPALTGTWNIGKSTNICYRSKNTTDATDEEKEWTDVTKTADGSKDDCDISYELKSVCLDENGQVKNEIATSEACNSIGTGTPDDDGENQTENQVTPTKEDDTTESGTTNGTDTGEGEQIPEVPEENKWIWTTKCYNGDNLVDDKKCQYDYMNVVTDSTSIHLTMSNTYNSIGFSKTDAEGNNISGAKLKVCTETDYNKEKLECNAYKTIAGEEVTWYSGTAATVFNGFAIGKYYLIEEKAAPGYILNTTSVVFSIDKDGQVTLQNNKVADLKEDEFDIIMLKNEITKMSISKQDMATTAEVPGAQLSICLAYKDEDGDDYHMAVDQLGDCTPATLANGDFATWTSTDKPYDVIGLPAGTYFLVEKIAPKNYSTAESILFTLREDGILVNKEGKPLGNNKLIMYDAKIKEVKTGMLPFFIVFGTLIGAVVIGLIAYYFMNPNNRSKIMKFRKRKVHKMSV